MLRRFFHQLSSPPCLIGEWITKGTGSACLLGKNNSGKTFILNQSVSPLIEKVSFEATLHFLERFGDDSVGSVCGGIHSASARSLVVRFGLTSCWTSQVNTLSTGELRKLTLARAMSSKPAMLLLDGSHDGLDPESREKLTQLLSSLSKGMPRLLVDLGGSGTGGSNEKLQTRILQVVQRKDELIATLDRGFLLLPDYVVKEVGKESLLQDNGSYFCQASTVAALNTYYSKFSNQNKDGSVATFKDSVLRFYSLNENNKQVATGGLHNLSLDINSGDTVAFVSQNGSGKSTYGRVLTTPIPLDTDYPIASSHPYKIAESNLHNTVTLFGHKLGSPEFAKAVREDVGVVSVDLHMRTRNFLQKSCEDATAAQVIASGLYGSACSGSSSVDALEKFLATAKHENHNDRVHEIADLVGLKLLHEKFTGLSLGLQRLVLIARALVHAPRLLVWDEVAQGLDSSNRQRVLTIQETLSQQGNVAQIVITHHADEIPDAKRLSMVVLEQGRVSHVRAIDVKSIQEFVNQHYRDASTLA